MSYHYIDATREDDAHALPDVETFYHDHFEHGPHRCSYMGEEGDECAGSGWYFAFLDGGLDGWSSEPCGPYTSEQEALESARQDAGYCPHGLGDDDPCAVCDTREGQ